MSKVVYRKMFSLRTRATMITLGFFSSMVCLGLLVNALISLFWGSGQIDAMDLIWFVGQACAASALFRTQYYQRVVKHSELSEHFRATISAEEVDRLQNGLEVQASIEITER